MSKPNLFRDAVPSILAAAIAWLVIASSSPASAAPPVKLASQGRFDLWADEAVGELAGGKVVAGIGKVERMNWRPAAEQPRGYTVHCAVSHIAWREFSIQFLPAKSGRVTLTLMGPWEQASPGELVQQEVQWDAIAVDGARLMNGGFEAGDGNAVDGWQANGGRVLTGVGAAAEGKRFAKTWHNATLATSLQVSGGKPVTLRLRVRAVLPSGFEEMKPIADRQTQAHQAALKFRRGANLGNYLEAPKGQNWGAKYSAADFERIQAEGFDHVRLPVAWQHYTGPAPDFRLTPEIVAKVDFFVEQAEKHKLGLMLNVHHFDDFTSDPAGQTAKFQAIWKQIAERYAAAPNSLAFELLNEPKDAATTDVLNPIYASTIALIRKSNPRRTIFVGPSRWNQVSELPKLRLPDDERNVIVTLHCYEPFYFTHQGASWTGADTQLIGIRFPGPPPQPLAIPAGTNVKDYVREWIDRYNREPAASNPSSPQVLRDTVQLAKEWSDYYGRPIHFGEFGAYIKADDASRANYYREFRAAFDRAGIGWAIWDWKAGFRYWDDSTGKPAPGMREALFPKAPVR